MVVQFAAPSGTSSLGLGAERRVDLQFLRASGLAQARLQVAVLSGNRRRALEQIDRLVAIDRELERLSEVGTDPFPVRHDLDADLTDQRLALASEKLALTSEISLPRLEPAFGAGLGEVLELHQEVEIVEEATIRMWLVRALLWAAGFAVFGAIIAAVVLLRN